MEKDKSILHIHTKEHQPDVVENVIQFLSFGLIHPNERDADIMWEDGTHTVAGGSNDEKAIENAKAAHQYIPPHYL